MSIEKLEKDLEGVKAAIEQGVANINVLRGQAQGLEHAIKTLKGAGASSEAVEVVAETIEH